MAAGLVQHDLGRDLVLLDLDRELAALRAVELRERDDLAAAGAWLDAIGVDVGARAGSALRTRILVEPQDHAALQAGPHALVVLRRAARRRSARAAAQRRERHQRAAALAGTDPL